MINFGLYEVWMLKFLEKQLHDIAYVCSENTTGGLQKNPQELVIYKKTKKNLFSRNVILKRQIYLSCQRFFLNDGEQYILKCSR